MANFDCFVYDGKPSGPAHSGKVPAGLRKKKDVLEAVSQALDFPDYFGGNWDAFEECVRELSWLPDGVIVLEHEDLPLGGDVFSCKTYLEILCDAVRKFERTKNRRLIVLFPPEVETTIRHISGG